MPTARLRVRLGSPASIAFVAALLKGKDNTMFGLLGANVAAMLAFANEVRKRREGIRQATRRLGRVLDQADWVGPDRERFIAEWHADHEGTLMGMIEGLDDCASRIDRHAHRQQETSDR